MIGGGGAQPRLNWRELAPSEVLAILKREAAQKGSCCSGFLDAHQWIPLANDSRLVVAGGHPQAQFRRVGVHCTPGVAIVRIGAETIQRDCRSVRELRSWLRQAGLRDDDVGDVAVGPPHWAVIAAEVLTLAKAAGAEQCSAWQPTDRQLATATVAANRADAVVAAVFHVSRGEAQTAIRCGFVFRDWQPLSKQTQPLSPGSQLVYRTKGRVEIVELGGATRSGRLRVTARLWPC